MRSNSHRLARRDVLKAAGGAAATVGISGLASAKPDEVVRVNVGFGAGGARAAAVSEADEVVREFESLDVVTATMPAQAADALSKRADVRYVEVDGRAHALAQTLPWGVDRVDADAAHADGFTGSGADVAIIDTGIDSDHPDLQANVGAGEDFTGTGSWDDDNDHGTHCAGIADAVDNTEGVVGVSTDATLHAVKVLDSAGSGYFSDIAAGIEHVADEGWDVGSMSLGGSTGSAALEDACEYAANNGVFLVAAAGNSGPCSNCVGYPAAYADVMAVSSTTDTDSLSSFSSTGPEIEIAAPGTDVYSTVPGGYATFSGTSMACPHVAGAAGQLIADGQSASVARTTIQNTAEDLGLGDDEQGAGLLDVEAALGGGGGDPDLAVSTGSASDVDESGATLDGSLDDLGGASSADASFEYRETGASSWSSTSAQTRSSTGSFSEDVSGLSSDTDYEFRAVADASDGDSATGSTATFTTDSDGGGGGDEAPTIDSYSVTEAGSPNPHAEITADWAVSDADGDLSSVTVTVSDSSGEVDSSTTNVGGSSASGSDSFKVKHGSGQSYDVELTVTDSADNDASQTESVSA